MNLDLFLDPENKEHLVKVIAPTHTYGTVTGFDSDYDFEVDYDEYDMAGEWEFLVVVNDKTLATFNNMEDTREFIVSTNFSDNK